MEIADDPEEPGESRQIVLAAIRQLAGRLIARVQRFEGGFEVALRHGPPERRLTGGPFLEAGSGERPLASQDRREGGEKEDVEKGHKRSACAPHTD
jgi:hypothetical protein